MDKKNPFLARRKTTIWACVFILLFVVVLVQTKVIRIFPHKSSKESNSPDPAYSGLVNNEQSKIKEECNEEDCCSNQPCPSYEVPECISCSPEYANPPVCTSEKDLLKEVKGICLVGSERSVREVPSRLEGIAFVDIKIPGDADQLESRLVPFLGKPLRACDLVAIKREVILYYRDKNHPLVSVVIPEQDITDSVIKVVVTQSTLNEVKVYGNHYFSKEFFHDAIQLKQGQLIDENVLLNNLNFINRNPFHQAELIYSPGDKSNTTDVEIIVKDRFPHSFYAGVDNTGLPHIERTRLFAGYNWGNVFGLGHMLSLQYSMAPDPYKFDAITASYTAPLSCQHILLFWGGYSRVNAHIPFSAKTHGRSTQASMRYDIPMTPSPWLLHELLWGFDFKRSNNTIEFVENFPMFGQEVNLTQFMVGYNLGYERCKNKLGFDVQVFFSPFSWLPDQSNHDFASLNPSAKHTYVYGRSSLNYKRLLFKGCVWNLLVSGQVSNRTLLPSEQFGLGGFATVRGYEERQLNGDDGLLARTEFVSPALTVLKHIGKGAIRDRIEFLAFLDYGLSHDRHKIPGIKQTEFILGTGPGIRYSIGNYLAARMDWGIKLHQNHFGGGWSMIHFSVIASY
jgi:hemolysin activation/secretion protein